MSEIQSGESSESRVSSEQTPWSVANFTNTLKDWITRLGNVWVEGQISQISPKKDVFFGELRDLVADKGFSIHSRRRSSSCSSSPRFLGEIWKDQHGCAGHSKSWPW
jgi:hypothetical protein